MAAAHAVTAAMAEIEPAAFCATVDVFEGYMPFPFSRFPQVYPPLVMRTPRLWRAIWRATDSMHMADALTALCWPFCAGRLSEMLRDYQPDVVVSVHPLLLRPALRLAAKQSSLRVACLVTDMVRLHSFWLHSAVDLYLLPTDAAAQQAVAAGIPAGKLAVTGQPIGPLAPDGLRRTEAKRALGLRPELPTVLVVAGAAGMGPLWEVASALEEYAARDDSVPLQLAVACGTNEPLRRRLHKHHWRVPTKILGYISEMPTWLRATDIIVTKAGPGTLAEALAEGLPILIMGAVPGQETDNVRYLCELGAALWTPTPKQVVSAVSRLLHQREYARSLARHALSVGKPFAAQAAARALIRLAGETD